MNQREELTGWVSPGSPRSSPEHKVYAYVPSRLLFSEKPRIRLGCPSRSTFFTGSSKVTSCGFWQKRVQLSDLLEGDFTVLQEPTLTVLLVLPTIISCFFSPCSPKKTFRTKNATESESRCGERIRYGCSKTQRRGLRNACFPRQNEAGKRYRK